ncbi:MAG TPA: nucleotide sugar dehydrogenase [Caulobacteraceae bacterium]|nr:nucleotide sugar dehydrogenase [Caulobacteraceae bacterium]
MTRPAPHYEALLARVSRRDAVVGVVGLGYVGLPLALTALDAGFPVIGFDINPARVEAINQAKPVIAYIGAETMERARAGGRFEASGDFARLAEPDVLVICVPTPINRNREPDLTFVVQTAETIASALRPGQLVVLESTTWPGTTAEVVQPMLERSGLRVGREVFLAFSPEREDPGNPDFSTRTIPKVVGADDPASRELATKFYGQIIAKVVPVSSAAAAEAAKLTENIFRSVNIALANELKLVYGAMGIDVWEVIGAAATKPFGYLPFWPGPGLGGHCIPVDPFYLTWKAREFGMETRFIELAGQINTHMPRIVVDRLAEALDRSAGRGLSGAKVLIIGAAYKRNVDDIRESPSLTLMELIEKRGASCDFHDPHVAEIPATREHVALAGRRSAALTAKTAAAYDAVLVSTDHDAVDYGLLAKHARLIVDTRNVFARLGLATHKVVKA